MNAVLTNIGCALLGGLIGGAYFYAQAAHTVAEADGRLRVLAAAVAESYGTKNGKFCDALLELDGGQDERVLRARVRELMDKE